MVSATLMACSRSATAAPGGFGMPTRDRNSSKRCRSEAVSIERAVEPRIGRPEDSNAWERLIAVWPPNCTTDAGASSSPAAVTVDSFSMMSRRLSESRGSK